MITKIQEYFTIPLWNSNIPNYQDIGELEIIDTESEVESYKCVVNPNLSVYLPSKKNFTGQAVLIIPGGGYQAVVYNWEGADVAKWLNSNGIAAIVLKYRLPNGESNIVRDKSPILDVTRAIKIVRKNAKKWGVDSSNIGLMGFSAGGHLASTLGTRFSKTITDNIDEIDIISARPNFMVLIYPVISMSEKFTHDGSRENLLGKNPTNKLMEYYSNEKHVTENTPPTFLVHTSDDEVVDVENSISFYKTLRDKKVNAEIHIFQNGEHGFSLANGLGNLESWKSLCIEWLRRVE